jgi:hypothetical protein
MAADVSYGPGGPHVAQAGQTSREASAKVPPSHRAWNLSLTSGIEGDLFVYFRANVILPEACCSGGAATGVIRSGRSLWVRDRGCDSERAGGGRDSRRRAAIAGGDGDACARRVVVPTSAGGKVLRPSRTRRTVDGADHHQSCGHRHARRLPRQVIRLGRLPLLGTWSGDASRTQSLSLSRSTYASRLDDHRAVLAGRRYSCTGHGGVRCSIFPSITISWAPAGEARHASPAPSARSSQPGKMGPLDLHRQQPPGDHRRRAGATASSPALSPDASATREESPP